MGEVKALLEEVVAKVGKDNMKILVCGPPGELEKLKPALGPRGARFIPLEAGALKLGYTPYVGQDTHITILPEFTVPDGKMGDAKAALPKFAAATKAGAGAANGFTTDSELKETPCSPVKDTRMPLPALPTPPTSRQCWTNLSSNWGREASKLTWWAPRQRSTN